MRIEQRWGFGMAPVKPQPQTARQQAVDAVIELVDTGVAARDVAEQLSVVKGLFTRTWKQDQWDWFTVWTQLGYPGRCTGREGSRLLAELREAVVAGGDVEAAAWQLDATGIVGRLERFPFPRPVPDGHGFVYILSTREQRQLLKVGYTERDVETRVKEINVATGVAVPYGVRALWVVQDAPQMERAVHEALAPYRVRDDREFFDVDFYDAFPLVRDVVYASRAEA